MKVEARRVAAFLTDPGAIRIVLLHGEDEGMVRHRADQLTRAVLGPGDDPFRLAWLVREDHDRLAEEAQAISMTGGRRVVRVRDASDGLAGAVRQIGEGRGDSLVVLEAGALPGRSKLRALVEGMPTGAALACYPEEGRALRETIEGTLAAASVRITPDALQWLLEHLGTDRASTRNELKKLVLYAGPNGSLDLDAARVCVGDQAGTSFDDAMFAATSGDVRTADISIELALAEGLAPVAAARGLLAHLGRLQAARLSMQSGLSAADAVKAMRPPVFFRRVNGFQRALETWTLARLAAAMQAVRRTELACKQTGAQDALLIRRLVLEMARQSAAASR